VAPMNVRDIAQVNAPRLLVQELDGTDIGEIFELVQRPDEIARFVFVNAASMGLTATETGFEMSGLPSKMNELEYLRCAAAKLAGLVDDAADATHLTPDIPKLAFVSLATDHSIDASSDKIDARSVDLVSRIISSQKFHNAYAVTAAIATAAAASVRGSTVHEVTGKDLGCGLQKLRIGHPSGIMDCSVEIKEESGGRVIRRAQITRTARRIMEGVVFVPGGRTTSF
jgi:2-methylaconitate cis-trans-isomerase PrpF